jgi:aryl-alcohol dehydrogenase-like predicted oxidoreductase
MGEGPNEVGLSRKHVVAAIEASLRRLKTDYLDLYQTHQPDLETPIDETLGALDDLVHQGKVRYLGCSNYPAHLLGKALWVSDKHGYARYESNQPRYNILYREIENEIVPLCRAEGLGLIVYNPLAGGFLTGRYQPEQDVVPGSRFSLNQAGKFYQQRYWQSAQFVAVETLKRFFAERERSLTEVALAWVLAQPGVTSAILGASRAEQLEQSLPGATLQLSAEELAFCDQIWFDLPRLKDPSVALR